MASRGNHPRAASSIKDAVGRLLFRFNAFPFVGNPDYQTNVDLRLSCLCGEVTGAVRRHSRELSNRGVCYCRDCRGFLRFLERPDLLDANGGTDIFQVAQGQVSFTEESAKHLACVRLSHKGMHRFYSLCCKTPLGNTISAGIPFVGLPAALLADVEMRELSLQPPVAIQTRSAIGGKLASSSFAEIAMLFRFAGLLARWKLGGHGKPSPYFDDGSSPRVEPTVLPPEARARLND